MVRFLSLFIDIYISINSRHGGNFCVALTQRRQCEDPVNCIVICNFQIKQTAVPTYLDTHMLTARFVFVVRLNGGSVQAVYHPQRA
jgi:hypothetical protein